MCVRSLSTRLRFLLPEYPRYLFPDIVLTTRKPIDSNLLLILPIVPGHVLQGRSRERTLVPSAKRSDGIVLLQDSLVEGCPLGDEVSSFVIGVEFGGLVRVGTSSPCLLDRQVEELKDV
jgi:hypothetical protein